MSRRRMMTLWYDDEDGELCDADVSPRFAAEDPILCADVTQDAVVAVEEMLGLYREKMAQSFALEAAGRDGVRH